MKLKVKKDELFSALQMVNRTIPQSKGYIPILVSIPQAELSLFLQCLDYARFKYEREQDDKIMEALSKCP